MSWVGWLPDLLWSHFAQTVQHRTHTGGWITYQSIAKARIPSYKKKKEIDCLCTWRANKREAPGHNPAFVFMGSYSGSTVFSSLRICDHDVTRANVQPAAPCVQLECINVKAITVEIRAWLRVCYSHVPRSAPTQPCRGGDRLAAYLLTCGGGALKEWKRHSDPISLVRQHHSDTILFYTTSDYLKSDWLLTTESLSLHVYSSPPLLTQFRPEASEVIRTHST